jgi:nucleotide-binding universal stress UspA family protein
MARFRNILLVVARDNWHREHYESALALAARENARLTVMEVVEETVPATPTTLAQSANREKSVLRNRRIRLKELIAINNRGVRVAGKVMFGNVFKETMQQVLRGHHDLVMLAPEVKQRSNQSVIGRGAMQLLRKCPCAIWIMKSQAEPSRIMAAVDPDVFDPVRNALNIRILESAAALARKENGELHIANAWTAPAEARLRNRAGLMPEDVGRYVMNVLNLQTNQLDGLLRRSNLKSSKPRTYLVKGEAGKVIPGLVRRARIHLLVMGSLGRSGIAGWLIGNTAEKILHQVDCSVLVIKPPEVVRQSESTQKPARSNRSKDKGRGSGSTGTARRKTGRVSA